MCNMSHVDMKGLPLVVFESLSFFLFFTNANANADTKVMT